MYNITKVQLFTAVTQNWREKNGENALSSVLSMVLSLAVKDNLKIKKTDRIITRMVKKKKKSSRLTVTVFFYHFLLLLVFALFLAVDHTSTKSCTVQTVVTTQYSSLCIAE